ncbi:hypothetical protein MS3_00005756 [Schistosoma haematobium]|uniref:ATP-dependent NAD(P)H-hydrate dehydratase n=1 Tax=Schistosoma haematobium TaxID=6185 RepID=A0A922LL56_SCHHA|nr:hypothetical protein MS3_00005756 [Schistosoma haematobium]KAH9588318.1 hypothetical protein MS3_00005756 [Schistosoma haematobium]
MDRVHAITFGPGLGLTENVENTTKLIDYCKHSNKPIVIDADALHIVTQNPSLIEGYDKTILTPNTVEFSRLYYSVVIMSIIYSTHLFSFRLNHMIPKMRQDLLLKNLVSPLSIKVLQILYQMVKQVIFLIIYGFSTKLRSIYYCESSVSVLISITYVLLLMHLFMYASQKKASV